MSTATRTVTATRVHLLRVNLEVTASLLLEDAARLVEQVIRPCVEQRCLRRLDFWAIDDEDRCHALLRLEVDWAMHARLKVASNVVQIDGRWEAQVAPELRVLLEGFERTVAERGLRVRGSLSITPEADRDYLVSLGLPRWRSRAWSGPPASTAFPVKGLGEMLVGLDLADEPGS